jgi:hypothetical protein
MSNKLIITWQVHKFVVDFLLTLLTTQRHFQLDWL